MLRRLLLTLAVMFSAFLRDPPAWSAPSADATVFYPGVSLRFEQITVNDGLSQNGVLAILQDRQGYLWVGTQDGLNRYDGYGFTHFKNDPTNPNSISYNSITSLYEDREGDLWIGTRGGGLNRYDAETGTFIRFLPDANDPASLSNP